MSDLLVVVLGVLAMAGLIAGVLGWQRAARAEREQGLVQRERRAERRALEGLMGWRGDTISVRGTVPVSEDAAATSRRSR